MEISLDPPRHAIETLAEDPVRGPEGAPIELVEFSDFDCPYCKRATETVDRLMEQFAGQIRFVYKDYPLPSHPDAFKAAEAGNCAHEQGRFWELHDTMFASQGALGVEELKGYAADLGLDGEAFADCLDSGRHAAAVDRDMRRGHELRRLLDADALPERPGGPRRGALRDLRADHSRGARRRRAVARPRMAAGTARAVAGRVVLAAVLCAAGCGGSEPPPEPIPACLPADAPAGERTDAEPEAAPADHVRYQELRVETLRLMIAAARLALPIGPCQQRIDRASRAASQGDVPGAADIMEEVATGLRGATGDTPR